MTVVYRKRWAVAFGEPSDLIHVPSPGRGRARGVELADDPLGQLLARLLTVFQPPVLQQRQRQLRFPGAAIFVSQLARLADSRP